MNLDHPHGIFASAIEKFSALLTAIDRLLAPEGCPWDQKQTLLSIRASLLEESCELMDAIHSEVPIDIEEELGDLLFLAFFIARLAEKEKVTTLEQSLTGVTEKLIRRHPHVFGGGEKLQTDEALWAQWEAIKAKERENRPKAVEESIPKALPALTRAQRTFKALKKQGHSSPIRSKNLFANEEELTLLLLEITAEAEEKGFDAEFCLRQALPPLLQIK